MTKIEAIQALMREARTERMTTVAARRVVRACKVLGINDQEMRQVLAWLEYCDAETGNPTSRSVDRVWP